MNQPTDQYNDYSLFFKFFTEQSQSDFKSVPSGDPLLKEIEDIMEVNKQIFYITDVINLDIKFISKGVKSMFGIEPDKVSTGFFLTTTHPDDLKRHHLARTKLICIAQELYIQKSGTKIISANFRGRIPESEAYANYLYQGFWFYSKIPYETVFLILVITDISDFKDSIKGFHYYIGNDPKMFRYPDKELLSSGLVFTDTEFKIISLIEQGMNTKEIADKLCRSALTINTHRSNIIGKSSKSNTTEVIMDLKAQGLL